MKCLRKILSNTQNISGLVVYMNGFISSCSSIPYFAISVICLLLFSLLACLFADCVMVCLVLRHLQARETFLVLVSSHGIDISCVSILSWYRHFLC